MILWEGKKPNKHTNDNNNNKKIPTPIWRCVIGCGREAMKLKTTFDRENGLLHLKRAELWDLKGMEDRAAASPGLSWFGHRGGGDVLVFRGTCSWEGRTP